MKNKVNLYYQKAESFPYEKFKYSSDKSFYRQFHSNFAIIIENREPFSKSVKVSSLSMVDFSSDFEVGILNMLNPKILTIIG